MCVLVGNKTVCQEGQLSRSPMSRVCKKMTTGGQPPWLSHDGETGVKAGLGVVLVGRGGGGSGQREDK